MKIYMVVIGCDGFGNDEYVSYDDIYLSKKKALAAARNYNRHSENNPCFCYETVSTEEELRAFNLPQEDFEEYLYWLNDGETVEVEQEIDYSTCSDNLLLCTAIDGESVDPPMGIALVLEVDVK